MGYEINLGAGEFAEKILGAEPLLTPPRICVNQFGHWAEHFKGPLNFL